MQPRWSVGARLASFFRLSTYCPTSRWNRTWRCRSSFWAWRTRSRFAADRDAFAAGGRSFLLERYLAALAASLPRTPMTILDHRLSAPDATVLDLRALPGAAAAAASDGE